MAELYGIDYQYVDMKVAKTKLLAKYIGCDTLVYHVESRRPICRMCNIAM